MSAGLTSLLPLWFFKFCSLEADRLEVLAEVLHSANVPFELVKTGGFRHVQVRFGKDPVPQAGEKVVLAHYDRVPGSPGANDNGASILALVDYLCRRRLNSLRVVFTDGEELIPGAPASSQGAYSLAMSWGSEPSYFPVVLDMTGIGDTLVLGHLGQEIVGLSRADVIPAKLDAYAKLRLGARRWLATCGAGDTLEVNTPFSDDLGFFLAGVPAVQISVLPQKQAIAYRRLRKSPGELAGEGPGALPAVWQSMHTADDRPENLWPATRPLMAELLDKLEKFPLGARRT